MKAALAVLALLLVAGCDRLTDKSRPVYTPLEEGRTLVYENPGQNPPQRQQMRVSRITEDPDGGRTVVETWTSYTGSTEATFRSKDGSWFLVMEGTALRILPEGFPDRVTRWEDRNFVNSIVGRCRVNLPGVRLPDPNAVGIWVESVPLGPVGVRRRTLLVPELGEVETLNWKDGEWVSVNRLVHTGFTDAPVVGRKP